MKAISTWHLELHELLEKGGVNSKLHQDLAFSFLIIAGAPLIIHLVESKNQFIPQDLREFSATNQRGGLKTIHLWEDVWIRNRSKVIDRICSFCGLDIKIHARKTALHRIDKLTAQSFLIENHMQGFASARFKYALMLNQEPVAVATFSSHRKMNVNENYTSVELIRFATKRRHSVAGALSKLIIGFIRLHKPNDVMTYVDRDWGDGRAFEKIGFKNMDQTDPLFFSLNEDNERILVSKVDKDLSNKPFNTGSVKMIFKC